MAWFGPHATHTLQGQHSVTPGESLAIDIKGLRFSGTDLGFDLRLTFEFADGRAAIRFTVKKFNLDHAVDLVEWMTGVTPFAGVLSGAQAAGVAKSLDPRSFAADGRIILALLSDGTFVLEALDGQIRISANRITITTSRLSLAIDPTLAPNDFPALSLLARQTQDRIPGYVPTPSSTLLWSYSEGTSAGGTVGQTKHVAANIDQMRFPANASVSAPPISIVLANLSPTASTRVAAKSFAFDARFSFASIDDKWDQDVANWPDFQLLGANLEQIVWGKHSHASLTGSFRESPTYCANGHVPVVISGPEGTGLYADAADEVLINFSANAQINHGFVPMTGADFSRIDFEGAEIRYGLGELLPAMQASAVSVGYYLASPPVFSAVMGERALVRVMRAADLLALNYSFRDIYLISLPGKTTLDSCENCLPGFRLEPGRLPIMIVRFPSQHIAEKAFLEVRQGSDVDAVKPAVPLAQQRLYETSGSTASSATLLDAKSRLPADPTDVTKKGEVDKVLEDNRSEAAKARDKDLVELQNGSTKDILEVLDHVVEARSAGPTRLVFEFDRKTYDAEPEVRGSSMLPRPYSVAALTQWHGLKAKVAARALRRSVTIIDQMRLAGIQEDTWAVDKTYLIDRSLDPPNAEDTAIEFPYRLQLSPASDARWDTPAQLTEERLAAGVALWTARLDGERGGRSVRALWSPDFEVARKGFFIEGRQPVHSNNQPWSEYRSKWWQSLRGIIGIRPQFRMSLDARDRHELVLLSSVYGLPALLPVPDPAVVKNPTKGNQRADSTVFPIPASFRHESGELGEEGVFSPQPLNSAKIALSSLGATVDLQGQWEPPSGFTLQSAIQPLWPALTVERWHHKAFLGRDTFVEIVYKGFLFPLGHRCSIIKSTERKFRPDPNDRSGRAPVAYLIQRYFVVVGEPMKRFPAVGQRYEGRALFANAINIKTTTTPDILDPYENSLTDESGNPQKFGIAGGAAFFPKTQKGNGSSGAVEFEYEVVYSDGKTGALKGPLIVVDNTLAHDPAGISQLVKYYDAQTSGRTADAAGQRFRYAEDKTAGSTEFVTDHWLLGAQGRKVAKNDEFQFTMDAVMEGADQPPFYPVCAEAFIEVQSLNYMNGKSQGFTEAAYDLNYLDNGFSPVKNPSGIFLSLPGNRTDLVVDKNTRASASLATPNLRAVAIGHKGPVGGAKATTNLKHSLGEGTVDSGSSIDMELSLAQLGKFDPLEALANAIKLPKLFSIIPLQPLIPILGFIEGAPEAIESTAYAISNDIAQFSEAAKKVASNIDAIITDTLARLDENLAAYSEKLGLSKPITLKDLYPKLAASFVQLDLTLGRLEIVVDSFDPNNPAPATKALGDTASAIRSTLREVKGVARHPTPAILDQFIKQLTDAFSLLGDAMRQIVKDEIAGLVADVAAQLTISVVFEREIVPAPQTAKLYLYVDGVPKGEVSHPDPELHPLYQIMTVALTGRPDSWVPVDRPETGITRHYEQLELVFNPQDLISLNVKRENQSNEAIAAAKQAASAAARQSLEEVLLYDDLAKPLLDGYLLLSNLIATLEDQAGEIEKQIRELPRQLAFALLTWVQGLLGYQRFFAVARSLLSKADAELRALVISVFDAYVAPLLAKLPDTTTNAAAIDDTMAVALDRIDHFAPATKAVFEEERSKLAKLRVRLRTALSDYEELRQQLVDLKGAQVVANFDRSRVVLAQSLGKFFAAQAAVLTALRDTITTANDAIRRGKAIPPTNDEWLLLFSFGHVQQYALALLDGVLTSTPPSSATSVVDLETAVQSIDLTIAEKLTFRLGRVNNAIIGIHDAVSKATSHLSDNAANAEVELQQLLDKGEAFLIGDVSTLPGQDVSTLLGQVAGYEQALVGLATRGLLVTEEAITQIEDRTFTAVRPAILRALKLLNSTTDPIGIYQAAEQVRAALDPTAWLTPELASVLELFLDKKLLAAFDELKRPAVGDTDLEKERQLLSAVQDSFGQATNFATLDSAKIAALTERFRRWEDGKLKPQPAIVLEPPEHLADLLLSSKLSDLIDLGELEKVLAEQLLSFIPAQVSFDYDWGVPLKPFPSESSKIFWIDDDLKDRGPNHPLPPFAPFKDKIRRPSDDLTIHVRAGVDLKDPLNPKPIFLAEADIRFADIHLFGSSFDVVTVKFEQIRFTVGDSGSDFGVQLAAEPVEFGEVVGFIKELSSVFGGGNGIYLRPAFNPLGIIVGYRYANDEIPLGTISLLNFSIDISVQLSFDNTPISFRFAVSERDKPLTLICSPYGGAGYLSLRTVASDIVQFEMQLEFGGAVVISFPPLSAHGFVSAGIYIEKSVAKGIILEGFVRAIGEGSIVCFSISVFFEVRIHQEGSNVTGQLTVRVSFKVGFVKLTYEYTAAYHFSGKQGGTSHIDQRGPKLIVDVADRLNDWGSYRAYFAKGR
ncbi:hypothetical protein FJ945_19630 [Mesorhizobium sp. B2-4-9]|uniref:hypothetical protein n=1 Tax=Mesorhizobium sp. B2-4-9 TaxID=2589940 RepID=UPI0011297AB0|nr:hypothetical protein [Mesorhizobium sp. B2-4-9]TPL20958.1 hypothetical protein FJ945_19630 [Mesorhizobium sp. B2-4-9]